MSSANTFFTFRSETTFTRVWQFASMLVGGKDMTTSSDQSVRQIVAEYPEAITVLERYGIDYRCGSESTLAEVCNQRNLNPTLVLEALGRQQQDANTFELKWQKFR